jgi:AAA+ ATPase superfamily predicted ATPase
MENPFRYGSVVTGQDFVDREKELELLAKELRSGQRILLFSNRRMGKSSLLKELARRFKKEFIFAHVDLYGVTTRNKFLEGLVEEVSRAGYTTTEKIVSAIAQYIKGVRFRVVITRSGNPGIELDQADVRDSELAEVIDFPEKVAKKRGKRVIVVLDEFQEVLAFGGVPLVKMMRSRMQYHTHATYIFSGSKQNLLRQIFLEKEGAFYKSVRPMELGPIRRSTFLEFIVDRFKAAGGHIDLKLAKRILDASEGYPYYAQQIAHELFDMTKSPASAQEVEDAIAVAVEHQMPAFLVLWDSIKSTLHRNYLLAVASEPGAAHGTAFIEKHRLRSYSHVQRIEKQLEVRGLIESGEIVDPMFALWLRGLKGPS